MSLWLMRPFYAFLAVVAALIAAVGTAQAAAYPILAGPWSNNQKGYGHARPGTIYNGGDGSGLVEHVRWKTWGGRKAIGTGLGLWLTGGEITADGKREPVRIVAYHLGYCHGRRAYNAIEWYFPQHGEHFNPHRGDTGICNSYGQHQKSESTASESGPVSSSIGQTLYVDHETLAVTPTLEDPVTADNEFETPKAGDRFVAVRLVLVNQGSSQIESDANVDATVLGTDEQAYISGFAELAGCTNFSSGDYSLAPGGEEVGCVVFELPGGVDVQQVRYGMQLNVEAEWSV